MLGGRGPLPDLLLYDGVSSSELGRDLVRAVRKVLEETLVEKTLNIVIETYSKEIKISLLHVWYNILTHVTIILKHTHKYTIPITIRDVCFQ